MDKTQERDAGGLIQRLPSNFAFLQAVDQMLSRLGFLAERFFEEDPVTALIKVRQFAEVLARNAAAKMGVTLSAESNQVDVLNRLRELGANPQVVDILHDVRRAGNRATHDMKGDHSDALRALRHAWHLGTWYRRVVTREKDFRPPPFVPPPSPKEATRSMQADLERLRRELEDARAQSDLHHIRATDESARREEEAAYWQSLIAERDERLRVESERLNSAITELQSKLAPASADEVHHIVRMVEAEVELDETETRRLIDQKLRDAGWEVDSDAITHAAGVRPQKGKNLAIAEWPTDDGIADYVLFVGIMPVAVVEAKRKRKDVAGAIEQAKRYSRGYAFTEDQAYPGGPWERFRIPFMFATNGRPFVRQMHDQSGIWFLDGRRPTNHPRAVGTWYTPEGLIHLLELNEAAADATLGGSTGGQFGLYDYQKDAIAEVEKAIARGQRDIMLAMATGTGKTRTSIGLIYRLLKAKRFRRVLFLVDRSALGEQASNAFKDVRLEQMQTLNDIYEIKGLGDIKPDSTTRLHFSTVQGMMRRVLFPADGERPVPADWYDLIIVDECHRGYNLDREMSEAEMTFRSEQDYISKYRRVLDHFDAVKVGLTATPALHTVEIFGKPVYRYTYRQAVIDGFLVDHEPPIRIVTELAEDGMRWAEQTEMKIYSTKTQQIDTVILGDEVRMELESYNRRVLTENFNRAVCTSLAECLDPESPEKTLVFCVNDTHADMVVRLMKEELDGRYGGIPDDQVMKITGSVDRVGEKIRLYKNERLPQVAVTVDLLTTGIDVPKIANLIFLRRVNSRILFDQMIGRATRLCPEIDKERFRIFDAVDLYEAIKDFTDMKPVVVNPRFTLAQMVSELASVRDAEARRQILEQIIARLQRKKRRLKGTLLDTFETAAGMTPEELIARLKGGTAEEASAWFAGRSGLAEFMDALEGEGSKFILSEHADSIRRVERGYGNAAKPEDYLESFSRYVRDHLNEIPALVAVTQRPRDLTRQQLKELRLELERAGFTEANLQTAWREVKNQDVAARIIGFIRQGALGSPLVPHAERVERAVNRLLASREWTSGQRTWLQRIGRQLKQETIVDRASLDRPPFESNGGYDRVNREFEGRIEEVLGDLQDEVWSDKDIA